MAVDEQAELLTEHYEDFLDCARFGEEDNIDVYLEHKVDVNWSDEFGITAMHRACANGHIDIVKKLVGRGAVLKSNTEGNTPLRECDAGGNFLLCSSPFSADWAAQQQQVAVAQYLLESFDDIDVLQKNAAGLCALDIAEDGKDAKLTALLLNHKSVDEEANRVTGADGEAPIPAAAAAAAADDQPTAAAAAASGAQAD